MGEEIDSDITLRDLQGNTLIVYWFLLRSDETFSSREIQRKTGISSSSLALHHLNKLIELGLVKKNNHGEYSVGRKVNPGLLSLFSGKGKSFIPRFVFYAAFSSGLLFSSIYMFYYRLSTASIFLILAMAIFSLIFWVESLRIWRKQPI
ncbi:MAG: winged helix-turn-helix domain-containing protein [Candidatus Thorarchaeota archaeon]